MKYGVKPDAGIRNSSGVQTTLVRTYQPETSHFRGRSGSPFLFRGRSRKRLSSVLAGSDVKINGDRPWDLQVHDERLYRRILAEASLGLGEAYMDGWWDCERLDEMMTRVFAAGLNRKMLARVLALDIIRAKLLNLQNKHRAFTVGKEHYDIGNDLYERMLDSRMIYSCGYWKKARTLDEAQEAKLELSARKLGLKPGMRVLDIGCGWGGAARYMVQNYGCEVVGVTISRAQVEYAKEHHRGLPIDVRFQDYRDLHESFDRVISIGMFEHVGVKNYKTFMKTARRLLADDGLLLLHTIGNSRTVHQGDPWISRYIFPNAMLPSLPQIGKAAEGQFIMEDWHNFGADYDTTLMHWAKSFDKAWPELREEYGERFYRMWKFYLLSCAAGFRSRKHQVWQIVFSPHGAPGGYETVR